MLCQFIKVSYYQQYTILLNDKYYYGFIIHERV